MPAILDGSFGTLKHTVGPPREIFLQIFEIVKNKQKLAKKKFLPFVFDEISQLSVYFRKLYNFFTLWSPC